MEITKRSNLLAIARVNFLTLTAACLALAMAISWFTAGAPSAFLFLAVSIAALAAHISVNAFNEYFDFSSGLDFLTDKTPFSGGSGALIREPHAAKTALFLALISLGVVILIGAGILHYRGMALLWLGLPGIVLIYTYTQYINRFAFLCLIAPGLGFGFMMTMGASWVLSDTLNITIILAAAAVMLLVNNLLLLNQFPDCEADAQVGRRHYPIVIGRQKSTIIFIGQWLGAYGIIVLGVMLQYLPVSSLVVFIILPWLLKLLHGVKENANNIAKLTPFLGLNVALIHVFLLLLALGIGLGALPHFSG